MRYQYQSLNVEQLITEEVNRLTKKYNKSFIGYKEIMEIMGIGRDSAKALLSSKQFPIVQLGNRKVTSITAFVAWQISKLAGG